MKVNGGLLGLWKRERNGGGETREERVIEE
jgi:hypothetical protein